MRTIAILSIFALALAACSPTQKQKASATDVPVEVVTNEAGQGQGIILSVSAGVNHNHPLMAVWVEDLEGNYVQDLFVARSIATGVFRHGAEKDGTWAPGPRRRPAALPRWGHQRGIQAADGLFVPDESSAVADAYSGATPPKSFILRTRLNEKATRPFRVFLEINQSWDWNEHWTNTLYPDDEAYRTSSQPALVYSAVVDPSDPGKDVLMQVVGRSHHAGADGKLYDDLETMTTALRIVGNAVVRIQE